MRSLEECTRRFTVLGREEKTRVLECVWKTLWMIVYARDKTALYWTCFLAFACSIAFWDFFEFELLQLRKFRCILVWFEISILKLSDFSKRPYLVVTLPDIFFQLLLKDTHPDELPQESLFWRWEWKRHCRAPSLLPFFWFVRPYMLHVDTVWISGIVSASIQYRASFYFCLVRSLDRKVATVGTSLLFLLSLRDRCALKRS